MRILVSGHHNPLYLTFVEYFENAIKQLGHQLIPFDDRQFLFPGQLRQVIPILQRMDLKRLNKILLQSININRPELVIILQGHFTLKETILRVKRLGIPIILWVIDPPNRFAPILEAAPAYDFIFCGGTEAIEILNKKGIVKLEWLPFACSPDIHFPPAGLGNAQGAFSEVVFVGSHYPSRQCLFETLNPDQYGFGIWGSGWERVGSKSQLKKHIRKTHTKPDEWTGIYAGAKIVLVHHYAEDQVLCYQASPKLYEALACGAFVLCDDQRDVRTLFNDREHLVIFKNAQDLNEKINFYLAHPEKREIIARQGRREVLDKHTYLHRVRQIMDRLNSVGILRSI